MELAKSMTLAARNAPILASMAQFAERAAEIVLIRTTKAGGRTT